MESNEKRDADALLPGLEEARRELNWKLEHSGGVYTERDEGRKEGFEAALNHVRMLINQIEES